jgi:UPF0271 protein
MPSIDINADVGEGCGFDAALMRAITSANIAAGFHAGGPGILRETVRLAAAGSVAIGAHPGFADPGHFGRRELRLPAGEIEALVTEQLSLVARAAAEQGAALRHVKPHGALYNMAVRDEAIAAAIARAVAAFDPGLRLFAPPGSHLFAAGLTARLPVVGEAFADRAYLPDGSLVPRSEPGAVIRDRNAVVVRALELVTLGRVAAIDGSSIELHPGTICVHGDTEGCDVLASALRDAFASAGIVCRAPRDSD